MRFRSSATVLRLACCPGARRAGGRSDRRRADRVVARRTARRLEHSRSRATDSASDAEHRSALSRARGRAEQPRGESGHRSWMEARGLLADAAVGRPGARDRAGRLRRHVSTDGVQRLRLFRRALRGHAVAGRNGVALGWPDPGQRCRACHGQRGRDHCGRLRALRGQRSAVLSVAWDHPRGVSGAPGRERSGREPDPDRQSRHERRRWSRGTGAPPPACHWHACRPDTRRQWAGRPGCARGAARRCAPAPRRQSM